MKCLPALTIWVAAGVSGAINAQVIPIVNDSFEAPAAGVIDCQKEPGCWYTSGAIPGWTVEYRGSGLGVFHPGPGSTREFDLPLPAGPQVAWLTGSSQIAQTLDATLLPNTQYKLSVDVGSRRDTDTNCCVFPGFTVALYAGNVLLGSVSQPTPPSRKFTTVTLEYKSPAEGAALGQPLTIRIASGKGTGASHAYFDNVKLDTIPEVWAHPYWYFFH